MRAAALAAAAVAAASAQVQAAPPRANDTGGKFEMRQSTTTSGPGEAARARVREGDCKGALPLFDEALRTSVEPTLFRDRGLCHDKLGDVYPAIDDYRAYVFGAPDEPDVDTIRARILELQGNAPPAAGDERSTNANQGSLDVQSNSLVIARPSGANQASLKGGSGFGLGAYFGAGGLFLSSSAGSGSLTTSYEKIGVQVRYDWSPAHALLLEGGYFHLDDKSSGDVVAFPGGSGGGGQLMYELRVRLDPSYNDQITFAIGGSINHVSETETADGLSGSLAQTLYGPTARISYRHVFGNTLAFDLAVEPAYLFDHPTASLTTGSGASSTTVSSGSSSSDDLHAVQVGGYVGLIFGP